MIKILQIIILVFFSLLMISASCDKGTEGCTDSTACNYDDSAAINDNSCWSASDGCDCEDPIGSTADCLGVCDAEILNNPPVDDNGNCCSEIDEICNIIVVGGCKEETNCKYSQDVTHNDGSCATDQSDFGGLSDGTDCNGDCDGAAVLDECDLCIGGSTNLGQSWRIKINSIATFNLQDGTSMGADTNSVTLGTSIYALDGYNGTELGGGDPSCESCYIDYPEPILTGFEDKNNFIRFYFPHDAADEWDEWGSQFDFDIDPYFDRDIRNNDYHSLFSLDKGMNWFAIVEPTLSDTIIFDENDNAAQFETILDSIYFQISHLEGIKCSLIKIFLDREKGESKGGIEYLVENNKVGIKVDTDKTFSVMINVSNICIQEFEESCLEDF